jgi:hypothetical protein
MDQAVQFYEDRTLTWRLTVDNDRVTLEELSMRLIQELKDDMGAHARAVLSTGDFKRPAGTFYVRPC